MDSSNPVLIIWLPLAALALAGVLLALAARRVRVLGSRRLAVRPREAQAKRSRLSALLEDYSRQTAGQFSPAEIASVWFAAAALPALIGLTLGWGAASLLLGCAGALAVPVWVRMAAKRSARKFEDMLGQVMPLIATNMRSGASINQAIAPVAANMGEPIKGEFARLSADLNAGIPMPEALEAMAARTGSKDLKLYATAVSISQQTGGSLSDITERVGETIRARTEMRAYVRSKTALNRIEAAMLAGLPALVFIALLGISPTHNAFYTSGEGLGVIAVALVLDSIGLAAIRRMGQIETD